MKVYTENDVTLRTTPEAMAMSSSVHCDKDDFSESERDSIHIVYEYSHES